MLNVLLNPTNLLFTIPMVVLAFWDVKTINSSNHKDHRNTVVGLGILGTFVGIFLGLQHFNPNDIQASIPPLLSGLKTAFWTSIAGMGISMGVTFYEKVSSKGPSTDNELDVLVTISKQNEAVLEQIRNFRLETKDDSLKNRNLLDGLLTGIKTSLDQALQKLSEGATKEIIKALEDVIRDFNNNLIEQFGDNFKQLNEGVKSLLVWQENYKASIIETEKALTGAYNSIRQSADSLAIVDSRTKDIHNVCKQLSEIIITAETQKHALTEYMKRAFELIESCNNLMQKANEQTNNLTDKIKVSLGQQSETLSKLTDDIKKQLPESLNSLASALATLTGQFRSDYEYFLNRIRELTTNMVIR